MPRLRQSRRGYETVIDLHTLQQKALIMSVFCFMDYPIQQRVG